MKFICLADGVKASMPNCLIRLWELIDNRVYVWIGEFFIVPNCQYILYMSVIVSKRDEKRMRIVSASAINYTYIYIEEICKVKRGNDNEIFFRYAYFTVLII